MFFLNEHLIAAFLSIAAFTICFFASLYFKVSLFSALLRSSLAAFVFMFVGLFFGKIMKSLIVEAFLRADEEKPEEKPEEEGAGTESSGATDEDLDLE